MALRPENVARIHERHIRYVYEVATSLLGRGPEAEDVCCEVFVSLVQIGAYAPAQESLPAYLGVLTRLRAREAMFRMDRRGRRGRASTTPRTYRAVS